MFAGSRPYRNRLERIAVLACACAFLGGCGLQLFLRVDRVTVDQRLLYFLGGGGNSFAFLNEGTAFISDPKFGPGARRFEHELEVELGRKVRRILLTHWHFDHAGGLALYDAPVVLVHPNTRARLLAKGVKANWVEVDHEVQLVLSGERVRVLSLGGGHTDGDLVALFESRKLLVTGDLVLDHFEPVIDAASGGSILALGQTLDRLLALDFERVLPGHGAPLVRADVVHLRAYLSAVEAAARLALGRGLGDDAAVKAIHVEGFDDIGSLAPGSDRAATVRRTVEELRAAQG
jgi:glyoxylase-like metal-dependent hydrolase (beta-lactamase superfamily II)